MSEIYKSSAIQSFSINEDVYINTYVHVCGQKCIIERTFLPDKLSVIEGGWYRHNDIDERYDLPINIKKCKPVVGEDYMVFTSDSVGCFNFDDSNFKEWLMDDANKEWYHCEFITEVFTWDNNDRRIKKIQLFEKGQIVVSFGYFNVIGLKHITGDAMINELQVKLAKAIDKYPYFKLDGCDLVFLSNDLSEEFKI